MNYSLNDEALSIGYTLQQGQRIIVERLGLYCNEELSSPAGGDNLSSHLQINGCKARDAIAQSTRGICRTGGLLADRPTADS